MKVFVVIALVAAAVAQPRPGGSESATSGWITATLFKKQYMTHGSRIMTLSEAVEECRRRGGVVFQPRDRDEVEFVTQQLELREDKWVWMGAWNFPDRKKLSWFNRKEDVTFSKFTRKT